MITLRGFRIFKISVGTPALGISSTDGKGVEETPRNETQPSPGHPCQLEGKAQFNSL